MRILILGGTGFIGSHLYNYFLNNGHEVTVTSKSSKYVSRPKHSMWNGQSEASLMPLLREADVVINLSGANIARGLWTVARKHDILQSRVQSCKALSSSLKNLKNNNEHFPKIVLQASGCGYYGLWEDMQKANTCTEDSPKGSGFLANVCAAWEEEMQGIGDLGIRLCTLRLAAVIGNVYDENLRPTAEPKLGGFLATMALPYRFFLGGCLGSGKQPVSWVHIHDVIESMNFLINNENAQGIFNICSPNVESMGHFNIILARHMQRPAFLSVPSFVLRLLLGEMGDELVVSGQKVSPNALTRLGYEFVYPQLGPAIQQSLTGR